MSEAKLYADRDIMQLDREGNHYCNHVLAMTQEGLHDKGDIAAELAFRDAQIDRVTAERDALQQRLTAADERADVLETALRKIKARLDAYAEADMRMPESSIEVCQMIADAALNPAEGGGDDTTIEEDREDFKKVFVRTNTKQGQSISLADMMARYGPKL